MRTTTWIAVGLLSVLTAGSALANNFSGVAWSIAQTEGDSKDYIDQLSGRGVGLEWRNQRNRNTSVSFYLGWNVFNQKVTETASVEDGVDATGVQFRYSNIFPILVGGQFYLGNRGNFRPYIGLNAGTYAIERRVEVGLFAFQETTWHLGVAPEVGFLLPMDDAEFYIHGRYNYAVERDDFEDTWFTINIGIAHVERLF